MIELPERLVLLQEAGDCADAYEPDPAGGFRLTDAAREQIDKANAELADFETQTDEELAKLQADAEKQKELLDNLVARQAIRAALLETDVALKFHGGIVDRLVDMLEIEVEESTEGNQVITVAGAFGSETIEQALGRWLETAEGELFMGRKTTGPGTFASAVRALRPH